MQLLRIILRWFDNRYKGANMTQPDWECLSPDEKKKELILKQKHMLDIILGE